MPATQAAAQERHVPKIGALLSVLVLSAGVPLENRRERLRTAGKR
jgi:hypothetical protein